MTDDEERYGVQAVQIAGILLRQLVAVVVGSEGPVPNVVGIVVYRVAVEGFEVVDDGHPVDECLAGIVGQGGIDNGKYCCQGDEQAENIFLLCFHRL